MTTIQPRIPQLMSVTEAAQLAKVSTKTVRRWIKSGALHVHQVGRLHRISLQDFNSFLSRNWK